MYRVSYSSKEPTEKRIHGIVNNLSEKLDAGVSLNLLVNSHLHKRAAHKAIYTLVISDHGKRSYRDYYSWNTLLLVYKELMSK